MSGDRESMVVRRHEDGALEIVSQGTETQLISRDLLVEMVASLNQNLAEIERLRAEVERLTQLHERIAASDDVAKAYQQVYFEDFPTVKQAVAETLLAKEQLAAERAEVERLRGEVERLMAGMELAWGLIANGQYWDRTDGRWYGDWNAARAEWRDEHWHPALDRNKEARREVQ